MGSMGRMGEMGVIGSSDEAGGVGIGFLNRKASSIAQEVLVQEADGVAASFIGVAVRVETSLDVGPFGPFPEELFEFLLTFSLIEGDALLFEAEAAGNEVAAAEGDNVVEKGADYAEVGFWVVGNGSGLGGGGEAGGDPVDEVVDERGGRQLSG